MNTFIHHLVPIALILVTSSLVACGSSYRVIPVDEPEVSPWQTPDGLATVCVLRRRAFGVAVTVLHSDNGQLVGATRGVGVYFCYHVEPGYHRVVASTDNDAAIDLQVAPGTRTFVDVRLSVGPERLELLAEPQARQVIPELSYIVTDDSSADEPVHPGPIPAAAGPF
jgi:hypothetical protein